MTSEYEEVERTTSSDLKLPTGISWESTERFVATLPEVHEAICSNSSIVETVIGNIPLSVRKLYIVRSCSKKNG